ncbi:hypothetical protein N7G274_007323 [Stereocaulon virgatum]|uniref:Uncharacterized protein n=1 Tax=Stereocaulon virgatum TaxID=373712 RepID=A0ABR4A221_9LECA
MAHIHPSAKRTVDVEKYGDPFDPGTFGNEEHCNSKIVTGFVLRQIEIFTESNACDKRLWEEAAEAFNGWTGDVLHLATAATVAKLRAYLLQHGVMVPNVKGTRKANTIMEVLQEEDYHKWTEAEVKSYMEDHMVVADSLCTMRPYILSCGVTKQHHRTLIG